MNPLAAFRTFTQFMRSPTNHELLIGIPFTRTIVRTNEQVVRSYVKAVGYAAAAVPVLWFSHVQTMRSLRMNSAPAGTDGRQMLQQVLSEIEARGAPLESERGARRA